MYLTCHQNKCPGMEGVQRGVEVEVEVEVGAGAGAGVGVRVRVGVQYL